MVCLPRTQKTWLETNPITIKPFFISLGIIFLIEGGAGFLIADKVRPQIIIIGIIRFLEIIALIFTFLIWGNGLSSIGLGASQIYPGLKRGVLWSCGFGIIVLLGFGMIFLFGINPLKLIHSRLPKEIPQLVTFFIVGGIIGPIAEEIFFRGILYGFLRQWGILIAIFLSSLIFVSLHSVSGVPLPQIIGGILFAVAYEIEGKLMVPITIHVLGNMAIFVISLLF